MIKRTLFDPIKKHLSSEEITLIAGPRQAGKTTLMKQLQTELESQGEKTIFLSLDFNKDQPAFTSQDHLIQRIALEKGTGKVYVFIDEIQQKENAGLFLKGLYDTHLPHKFIVSGSGSVELKEKIHESLPGRKRLFELTPLSFEEFINYKTGYKYMDNSGEFAVKLEYFDVYYEQARDYLQEYLNYGGYPKVVLAQTNEEKHAVIADIYRSYLEKDIAILLNIQKSESLTSLVRILASQAGNLVNVAELSATIGISVQTVRNYLWYLEKTYIISRVTPYFKNVRKEITKAPTYYFVDLGLKNYALGQFGIATNITTSIPTSGFLFQNFVFNCLRGRIGFTSTTIHFWRTQDKAEVDFVLNTGHSVIPVEVKYSDLKTAETTRSFKSFLTKYKPTKACIIHLGKNFESEFEETKIYFIPFFNCKIIFQFNFSF